MMRSYMELSSFIICKKEAQSYQKLCRFYLEHKFDIFGSGWKKAWYGNNRTKYQYRYFRKQSGKGIDFKNFVLPQNMARCLQIRKQIESSYRPINWFVDLKSGFVFHPFFYHSAVKCRHACYKYKNADIKGPWELGRCYHLPQMAIYAVNTEKEERKKIISEYKNEILDFISMNPQEQSVQWAAVMEVAVRAVNWLTAYDLLKQIDSFGLLDDSFEEIFQNDLYKSGCYILENLEYYGKGNNTNHYLSNIVGLSYIAAYLPETKETNSWLAFCRQEIIEETLEQFHTEGSHKEASTCYHRLSAEFVCYTTYILSCVYRKRGRNCFTEYDCSQIERLKPFRSQKYKKIDQRLFPEEYSTRLYHILQFTKACINNEGEAIQVGDNDSGRLLKLTLTGTWENGSYKDSSLDFSPLINSIKGLLGIEGDRKSIEYKIFAAIGQKGVRETKPVVAAAFHTVRTLDVTLPYSHIKKWECEGGVSLKQGLNIEQYPGFGIVAVRSGRLYIAFVIDTTNVKRLGHAHNDKLSFTMYLDGQQKGFDQGSYIYTGNRKVRDYFRSTRAHNTIYVSGVEQNEFVDFFQISRKSRANIIKISKTEMIACESYDNVQHIRRIAITDSSVTVSDYCNQKFKVNFEPRYQSRGYGEIQCRKKDVLYSEQAK